MHQTAWLSIGWEIIFSSFTDVWKCLHTRLTCVGRIEHPVSRAYKYKCQKPKLIFCSSNTQPGSLMRNRDKWDVSFAKSKRQNMLICNYRHLGANRKSIRGKEWLNTFLNMVQKETKYTYIYNTDNVHTLVGVTMGRHAHIELSK